MFPVPLPAVQEHPDHPEQARAVDLKIPSESLKQVLLLPPLADMRMAVIEAVLPMRVGR